MSNATANSSIRPTFGGTVYRSPMSRLPPSGSKVSKLCVQARPQHHPSLFIQGPRPLVPVSNTPRFGFHGDAASWQMQAG